MITFQHIRKYVVFIVILVLAILITRYCFPIREVIVNTTTIIDYKDTTIYKDTVIYTLYPVEVEVNVPIEIPHIPEDYDSLKSLHKELHSLYTTFKKYESTIALDSIGEVNLEIFLSKNSLDSLKAEYSYKTYEKIVTITNEVYKNNWYLYGNTDFSSVGLGVMYTHQNYIIGGGYNFNNKTVQVGAGINISRLWK